MYRHIIVGGGLIGSAAARHLSSRQDGVALVGPAEPVSRSGHDGVFASHYDEGRITRIYDPAPEWSLTAARSIARYREIEAAGETRFFTPAGFLGLAPPEDTAIRNAVALAAENFTNIRGTNIGGTSIRDAGIGTLDTAATQALYPFLSVPDNCTFIHETGTAGHISPRALVAAQIRAAEKNGADILRTIVTGMEVRANAVIVTTGDGRVLKAGRVLVATGGYTGACTLLPRPLALTVYGRTVLLIRVTAAVTDILRDMPAIIDYSTGAYILPPIRYPDGHSYVKIGSGTDADPQPASRADLDAWFRSAGSEGDRRALTGMIEALIPALKDCPRRHTETCVTTYTASGLPYIDFVAGERLAVAVGGNGKGAKGSDDWGYIAACLMEDGNSGNRDYPVPRHLLRAVFA